MQKDTTPVLHPRELGLVFGSRVHELLDCVGEIIVEVEGRTHDDGGFVVVVVQGVAADFLAFFCDLWGVRAERFRVLERENYPTPVRGVVAVDLDVAAFYPVEPYGMSSQHAQFSLREYWIGIAKVLCNQPHLFIPTWSEFCQVVQVVLNPVDIL